MSAYRPIAVIIPGPLEWPNLATNGHSTLYPFPYAKGTLVGKSVSLLMPGPDRSAHDGYLAKYLKTGQAIRRFLNP